MRNVGDTNTHVDEQKHYYLLLPFEASDKQNTYNIFSGLPVHLH